MSSSGGASVAGSSGTAVVGDGSLTTTASGNQAAAAAVASVATLAGAAGKFTYLTALVFNVGRAAAVGEVVCTLAGIKGGTWTFTIGWLTTADSYLFLPFPLAIPSSAVDTSIVGTIPSTGVGGPASSVLLVGYVN